MHLESECSPGQKIRSFAFQLARAGTAKGEAEPPFFDEPVHRIEEYRDRFTP
jgi:hypothetical protein